jgi:ABC-type branched-subunit amino acid transport system substrate-binding protein
MFADTGQAAFDHTQLHYFWRVTPADDVKGDAMAIWAHEHGFTKGAVLFGNDLASQSNVPTLVKGFEAEGGHIVSTLNIALDQVSYRTEIENMLASNPQFIFTETDPPTAATFFTEMLQLNHQKLLPIIGTEQSLQANFLQAVSQAIGVPTLKKYLVGVQPYAPTSGASWKVFKQVIFAGKGATHANLEVYSTDPFAMSYYDSVVTMALAMEAAKSVSPAKYNSFIKTVTEPGKGKLEVHSFAQGEKALEAGHKIRFVGSTGIIAFDASGNSTGGFEVAGYRSPGNIRIDGVVSAAAIAALIARKG